MKKIIAGCWRCCCRRPPGRIPRSTRSRPWLHGRCVASVDRLWIICWPCCRWVCGPARRRRARWLWPAAFVTAMIAGGVPGHGGHRPAAGRTGHRRLAAGAGRGHRRYMNAAASGGVRRRSRCSVCSTATRMVWQAPADRRRPVCAGLCPVHHHACMLLGLALGLSARRCTRQSCVRAWRGADRRQPALSWPSHDPRRSHPRRRRDRAQRRSAGDHHPAVANNGDRAGAGGYALSLL